MEWMYWALICLPFVLIGWGALIWVIARAALRMFRERSPDDTTNAAGLTLPIEPADNPEDVWNEEYGGSD